MPVEAVPAEACSAYQRLPGSTPTQAAILQSLCAYRDRQARYANLPAFKVLPNEALLAVAQTNPAKMEDLVGLPG